MIWSYDFWFFFGIRNFQRDFFFDFRISSFLYNFNCEIFRFFREKKLKKSIFFLLFWSWIDFLSILDSGVARFHPYSILNAAGEGIYGNGSWTTAYAEVLIGITNISTERIAFHVYVNGSTILSTTDNGTQCIFQQVG